MNRSESAWLMPELPGARVLGSGLGAATAVLTLERFGWRVVFQKTQSRHAHPIVLNSAARFLIGQICGESFLERLPHHRLSRRLIAWTAASPIIMDEAAVVVDSGLLASTMLAAHETQPSETSEPDPVLTIDATGRPGIDFAAWSGGRRHAALVPVTLLPAADRECLVIEAATDGWLALMPTGETAGILFAFGLSSNHDMAHRMLATAPLIRTATAEAGRTHSVLSAAPYLRVPEQFEPSCLPVGRAAMSFDPLSGDGAAVALRTAHLVTSIGQANFRHGDQSKLSGLYAARLMKAMKAHLRGLLSLYACARFAQNWASELEAMQNMLNAIESRATQPWPENLCVGPAGIRPRPNLLAAAPP